MGVAVAGWLWETVSLCGSLYGLGEDWDQWVWQAGGGRGMMENKMATSHHI